MRPRIVIAGTGFPVVRAFLEDALPVATLQAVDVEVLRRGFTADVLLPAMARIDGELMAAIAGLRLGYRH